MVSESGFQRGSLSPKSITPPAPQYFFSLKELRVSASSILPYRMLGKACIFLKSNRLFVNSLAWLSSGSMWAEINPLLGLGQLLCTSFSRGKPCDTGQAHCTKSHNKTKADAKLTYREKRWLSHPDFYSCTDEF